ncbi:c1.1 [Ichnoviriform fugitivi]|uniref:C1.1 n=1 Tax=Ichnoviriform fugitivi TaxID=265522 RepID=A2Q0F8_9VIRU|nr:c1.1 [Ichnoviriform fugitivi]BAF45673.1 c1.1 [Ichnoviriform fugitivi]
MYVTNNNQFGLRCVMQSRCPICTLTTDFLVFESVTCNIYCNLLSYVRVGLNFIVHDLYTVQKLKPCELEDIFSLATNEIMANSLTSIPKMPDVSTGSVDTNSMITELIISMFVGHYCLSHPVHVELPICGQSMSCDPVITADL